MTTRRCDRCCCSARRKKGAFDTNGPSSSVSWRAIGITRVTECLPIGVNCNQYFTLCMTRIALNATPLSITLIFNRQAELTIDRAALACIKTRGKRAVLLNARN
jgi:hypothetical protein